MYAAENDVASPGLRCQFGEPPTVALIVGKPDYFVALVVVPQHNTLLPEDFAGSTDTSVARVIRQDEVVVQGARRVRSNCSSQSLSAFSSRRHLNWTTRKRGC